ncbi:RagB/SusD family nutrient uptake outer membrane protein [Belliella aquatica]|uniref:Glycan metabolism protein RagB n=1 Tax=Belliella aquatica TaxID=1323734 RepID=A0ABQ1N278_9BACT|nr:RagB/SusD family nutrient uptake outer membrane protein [Belliella aquatica]MCH7407446.1 RagB/SusD family nutrient uptake outer membrane protein [Belliella aquatica]GGC49280.1 glycan metabolism protein RagB [Belliella aquatica]
MKNIKIINYFMLIGMLVLSTSCDDFLDKKPNLSLEIPESLDELEALMSAENQINQGGVSDILASDDFFHTEQALQTESNEQYVNTYLRNFIPEMYGDRIMPEWTIYYGKIYVANFCLQQIDNINRTQTNASQFDRIKGNAFFLRAYAYSELLKIFTPQYSEARLDESSIPLVLDTDINTIKDFAPLGLIYTQIFEDLDQAEILLPTIPEIRTRGSKSGVNALKARVYLTMKAYDKALDAVEKSLAIDNQLIDFNTLNPGLNLPIVPVGNQEIIFYYISGTYRLLSYNPECRVNLDLYYNYDENDLRKRIYFFRNSAGNINYKGHFTGRTNFFTGLSVSENLLIKAECAARLGDMEKAFDALNELLSSRFSTEEFIPISASEFNDPLGKILLERRKELVFRGRRWSDLKRFLGERQEDFPLTRLLGDTLIEMDESPEAFVFPIPLEENTNR